PDSNRLYFVYVEPGVAVTLGSDNSITSFLGYHNNFTLNDGTPVYYAVIPYAGPPNATIPTIPFDQLTEVSSHELAEAVTDPVPGQGWYDYDLNGEIGDIVNGQSVRLNGYLVQKEASKDDQPLDPNAFGGHDLNATASNITATAGQLFQGTLATFSD